MSQAIFVNENSFSRGYIPINKIQNLFGVYQNINISVTVPSKYDDCSITMIRNA